ncbi:MAG: ABC transporter permease [Dissulfurispiraceae bacterium]|jgi:phospholipid/cholesterol/gamma-HCH transport system permease protein|nr:ABC transporter permease [Dissulfurispiraceae bacterium]
MTAVIEYIGILFLRFVEEAGRICILFLNAVRQMFRRPFEADIIIKQMVEIGVKSLPVVIITALFTGMVLAVQSYTGFKRFGAQSVVGFVVSLSMVRELGPVLTGLIVAGRAGASMAAELGTMRVTEQIDALETLAANPVKYLVVPRFISTTLMMPALAAVADLVGIVGGFMVTVKLFGVSSTTYWKWTWNYLDYKDIYYGLVKAAFFGACIAMISCSNGFYTQGGAEGVGKATTRAVVLSSITILVSDYFLSAWMFR